MTSSERKAKIAAIKELPEALLKTLHGLSDDQLDTPYREGGWTVRQVVHHLADSHLNAYVRMKLIVTEERPTLKPYDQDAWSRLADVEGAPLRTSLEILEGLHERWTILMESFPEEAWGRKAIHPEHGEVTLENLLTTYAEHGKKHMGHILGLRNAKGW